MKKTLHVVAAIIRKDDKILIARRLYGNQAGLWEFPGGKYEEGETGEQALIREIREEFEAEISVDSFLCTVRHRYSEFNLVMDCYVCHFVNENIHLHDHSDIRWIKPHERGIKWVPADRKVIKEYKNVL